jgi:hypothetical protein
MFLKRVAGTTSRSSAHPKLVGLRNAKEEKMTQSKKLIVSAVAGMGLFCGLDRANAGFTVSPNLSPVGTPVDGITYGYTSSSTRASTAYDEITNANTNYATGFEKTYDDLGSLVWDTSLSLGTPIYIGFQSDNSTYAKYDVNGNNAFNYPATATLSAAPQQADPYLLTSTGIVGGETTRNFVSGTTNTARGMDALIYTPGTNTLDGTTGFTGVYTPTVVNPQTSIADTNGDGITSNYFYTTAGDTVNNVAGTIQAVNNASQAVGTSTRYTGTTSSTSLGTDVWLSTQTSATNVSTVLLGLGSGSATAAGGYAYTSSGNILRTSGVISGTVANNRGLTDTGEAAGTTNRYDDATSAGTSSSTAGVDSWVYTSTTGTVQVGLAGAGSAYEVPAGGGLSANVPYRYSKIVSLNPSGQVAGTSWNFSGVTAGSTNGTPNTSGWQTWVYTPSGTPVTSSTLGSNGYAQVGLTDLASGSNIGHATNSALSTSTTYPNYTAFNGTTLYGTAAKGYNLVSGLSNNGIAAGVALRFDASGNTDLPNINSGLGQDAWVNTTNVSPVALYAANPSSVSYYQPSVSNSVGPHTVATVTSPTQGLPSVYVNASQSLSTSLNPGYSSMSVLGMNSTGLTVGSIVRTDNGYNIGQDLWVYDPSLAKEFILAAPAATSGDYGSISFQGVTDSGVVFGTYITNASGQASSTTGGYLFDWSESTGLVTLDQLYSGTATSPTYLQLNNALAGQTNAYDLFGNGLSLYNMFADSSGDLFLDGNTSAANGISNGAFEVSAVPEPTTMSLLMLGTAGLLSRRRRRMA